MSDEKPDNLDVLLTEHLSTELAGQMGRAAGAFETLVMAQRAKEASRRNRRAWIVAVFPAALAACIALVATVGYHSGKTSTIAGAKPGVGSFDQTTYYRDVDDGTIIVNSPTGPVPVRAIRRQVVNEMQWVDPKDQTVRSMRVPQEKMVYVGLQPF